MSIKQALPIGRDDFREIREGNFYYMDKTLMIKDFIELQDKVALIARPRRFGKTLNMSMIREFFDITRDSWESFKGLAIMETEYAGQINSRPVIYFTFKDVKGSYAGEMMTQFKRAIREQYGYYHNILKEKLDYESFHVKAFLESFAMLMDRKSVYGDLSGVILDLTKMLHEFYKIRPILLIDEYDQPIMSSYEYGYHDQLGTFFSNLYGSAMKSNPSLGQALMTGVQRVAKESIFSQFNNAKVYTVLSKQYAPYFGLTVPETEKLLKDYGLALDENVQKKYNGYRFGDVQLYNPWSILYYAEDAALRNYWINTSSNTLIKKTLQTADREFWDDFDRLALGEAIPVWLTLETSYLERLGNDSLWGLLVNAGYLTALKQIDDKTALVKIPNGEVMSEFEMIIAGISGVSGLALQQMFERLRKKDMDSFITAYQKLVLNCTSYMDAKENAYHMLFLGMAMTLQGDYKVTSNLETGHGRSDIMLEALKPVHSHMIIEFKQGKDIERLKEEALRQILDNQYYAGLSGEVICIGLAHDKKRCSMVYKAVQV